MISVLSLIFLTFSSCAPTYKENSSFAMGSYISSKVYTDDDEEAQKLFDAINAAAAQADKALSATEPEAEIYELNTQGKVFASDYLIKVINDTLLYSEIFDNKADPTLGKITSLWGFDTDSPSLPEKADIEKYLSSTGVEKIEIDEKLGKVTIPEDTAVDLGAFGKGAACDLMFDNIRYFGKSAIVSFGGTVFAFGDGPSDGRWKVAIRDPFGDASSYFATLSLSSLAPQNAVFVSTSGSYEKTFTEGDTTYHHILDPKTGYPVDNELVSVTIIASSGLLADALSTACFVNGYNEETVNYIESSFAEAVFIFGDKTYLYTDGLEGRFTLNSDGYTKR